MAFVRSKIYLVAQCAVAAGVAWWIAADVFNQPAPYFAPIAAMAALGTSYAQRLTRVFQVTIGTVLGVFVADQVVSLIGSGAWQVGLICGLALLAAVTLSDSPLVPAQAGAQAVIVATIVPPGGVVQTRWIDALIGGCVALVAATLVPSAAIRSPGVRAAEVCDKVAELLRSVAQVMRSGETRPAILLLIHARATDQLVSELRAAAEEGLDILDSSPLARWRHRGKVRRMAQVVVPLDRALRSTRVLVRQASVSTRYELRAPASYATLAEDLAEAVDLIAAQLRAQQDTSLALSALEAAAEKSGRLERTAELASEAQLAQLRSIIVDLMMVCGVTAKAAIAKLPPPARHGA